MDDICERCGGEPSETAGDYTLCRGCMTMTEQRDEEDRCIRCARSFSYDLDDAWAWIEEPQLICPACQSTTEQIKFLRSYVHYMLEFVGSQAHVDQAVARLDGLLGEA